MSDIGFALNYTNLYLIDTTPDGETHTWARLGRGINTVSNNDSDSTEDYTDYASDGNTETEVTGGSHGYTFEGDRDYNNAAQNYVAGLRFEKGEGRKTYLKHIAPNGASIVTDGVVANIVDGGGDANARGTFSFDFNFGNDMEFDAGASTEVPKSVTATAVSVKVGATSAIAPNVEPTTASAACAYAVDDPSIATVDDDGNVTGVKTGSANVSIKCMAKPTVKTVVKVTVTTA